MKFENVTLNLVEKKRIKITYDNVDSFLKIISEDVVDFIN